MALPPILVELKANSREFVTGMKEAQHEVQKLGTQSSAHLQKFAAVGKAALFGVGAVALTVGGYSLEMADKFEEARTRLEGAVHNVHGNFEALKGQIVAVDGRMTKLGFTTTETESALAGLTTATKNPAKAMRDMALAADLARGRHIDLATASNILVKVETGHVGLLGRLGIATKDATGHTISQHEALKRLAQLYGGDASRYSETFGGKVATLKAQMVDLSTRIGLALIPVLERLGTIVAGVVNWFEKHAEVAKILAVAVGAVLVTAIGAFVVSLVTATVAIGETEIALAPITLALALLGVGIYELATHWSQVWGAISSFTSRVGHDILHVLETWGPLALAVLAPFIGIPLLIWQHWHQVEGFISRVGRAIFGFLEKWGPLALAVLDPFIGIPLLIWQHWRQIERFVAEAWHAALVAIEHAASDIVTFVKGIPAMIIRALGDVDNLLVDVGKRIIGGLIHGLEHGASGVKNTLTGLTHKIVSWKGPPEKDATLLTESGRKIIEGLIAGIVGKKASLQAELSAITKLIHDGLTKGFSGAAEKLRLSLPAAFANALNAASVQAQKSMAALADKLKAAQSQLAQDLSAKAQLSSSLGSGLAGYASLSNSAGDVVNPSLIRQQYEQQIAAAAAKGQDTSSLTSQMNDALAAVMGKPTDLLSAITDRLGTLTTLHTDLSQLQTMGLSPEILGQIASMQADQGVALAGQILNGPGGTVAQFNSIQRQVDAAATSSATAVANAEWGNSIATDTKNLNGILAENKKHTLVLQHLAHAVGLAVAEAMKSPGAARALRNELLQLQKSSGMSLGLT